MTPRAKIGISRALGWLQVLIFAAIAAGYGRKIAVHGHDPVSWIMFICGVLGMFAALASRFVPGGT